MSVTPVSSTENSDLLLGFSPISLTPVFEKNSEPEMSTSENMEGNTNSVAGTSSNVSTIIEYGSAEICTNDITAQIIKSLTSPEFLTALKTAVFSSPEFSIVLQDAVLNALKNQVATIIKPVQDRVAALERTTKILQKELAEEKAKAKEVNVLAQSGKINNLIIAGIEEKEQDSPTDSIKEIVNKLNMNVGAFTAERVGKSIQGKPRPILVKCQNVWDRRKLYAARVNLRSKGFNRVFINEDLTKTQAELFYHARMAKAQKQIKNAWTMNGSIFIKQADQPQLISSVDELKAVLPGYKPSSNR